MDSPGTIVAFVFIAIGVVGTVEFAWVKRPAVHAAAYAQGHCSGTCEVQGMTGLVSGGKCYCGTPTAEEPP